MRCNGMGSYEFVIRCGWLRCHVVWFEVVVWGELLCTTPVLQSTTPVLQSTTPVLLCTTKYYSSTSSYYKVLLQYYSVLQSTTPVLVCTTKYYSGTTLYYKVHSSTTMYIARSNRTHLRRSPNTGTCHPKSLS